MAERKIIKGRVEKTDPKYPNNWKMTYLSSKGGYRPVKGHTGRFSPGVHEAQEKVVDVIFEWESGKADRIRLPDEDVSVFNAPVRAPKQMDADEADAPLMRCLPACYKRRETKMKRKFVNPYNFVPAPPPETDGPLGQHAPAGHHRYHEERWNGRIEVEIETITPLLLPDAAKEDDNDGHKTFPIRRGPDDRPYLAPTALKGMLRSAYEAITNSRLSVFTLKERLPYRVRRKKITPKSSPHDLLPPRLRPATALDELSPADRVFGWVKQQGHGAWRGSLRIGAVRCETDNAIEALGDEVNGRRRGLPLAILSTPKPQQAHFYVARDACGGAQDDGLPKDKATYAPGKGLRGRKVYPHHAQVSDDTDYWDAKEAYADARQHQARALKVNGKQVYREYVRHPKKPEDPSSNRDEQNRSMTEWVRPGVVFSARLEVENLNKAELGALLWLLDLPDGHCLRLGYGKPLGFGSVQVRLRAVDLVSGAGRKEQLSSLLPVQLAEGQRIADIDKARERFVKAFQAAIEKAYGTGQGSFAQVPFITAFLKAAKGIEDMPVHYPRTQPQPDPKGENFRWFGDNEREMRLALPDLVASASVGLPYMERSDDDRGGRPGQARGRQGRQRGGRQRG